MTAPTEANAVRTDSPPAKAGSYCCAFRLGGSLLAIDVAHVQRTVNMPPVRQLPAARPGVIGLCNVRAEALTAVDLAHLLELPPPGTPPATLLVLQFGALVAAAPVDRAEGVFPYDPAAVVPEPPRVRVPSVRGRVPTTPAAGPARLLDAEHLRNRLQSLRYPAAAVSPGRFPEVQGG